ncbi:hypothetical protein FRC12_022234 [Ceratobasidium sp. 428]|nr:hypothetical protein FRC12_022234 [Ceratobasidium sp. 428]
MVHVMASRHFSFAGFVVLLYDHLLTFGDEVQLVWSQPTSVVSVIFLVNRYLAPAVLAVDIYGGYYTSASTKRSNSLR